MEVVGVRIFSSWHQRSLAAFTPKTRNAFETNVCVCVAWCPSVFLSLCQFCSVCPLPHPSYVLLTTSLDQFQAPSPLAEVMLVQQRIAQHSVVWTRMCTCTWTHGKLAGRLSIRPQQLPSFPKANKHVFFCVFFFLSRAKVSNFWHLIFCDTDKQDWGDTKL